MTAKASLAIHPGEYIADELAARRMTAADLARAMQVMSGVCRGWSTHRSPSPGTPRSAAGGPVAADR